MKNNTMTDDFTTWFDTQQKELDKLRERLKQVRAKAQSELEEAYDTARSRDDEIQRTYEQAIKTANTRRENAFRLSSTQLAKEMQLSNKPVQQAQEALQVATDFVYEAARQLHGVDFEAMLQEAESLEGVA